MCLKYLVCIIGIKTEFRFLWKMSTLKNLDINIEKGEYSKCVFFIESYQ